jgi:hypothetical protein
MICLGDKVELIDENTHDGDYRGRMLVVGFDFDKKGDVICEHPDYDEFLIFEEDELVVMREAK